MNALLSFAYTILANDCAAALESVGLDSYVGFLHRDRPGRKSLALDLMEEFRPIMADRFVITLINNKMIKESHFEVQSNGAVLLNDEGRKIFLTQYQNKKKEKPQFFNCSSPSSLITFRRKNYYLSRYQFIQNINFYRAYIYLCTCYFTDLPIS